MTTDLVFLIAKELKKEYGIKKAAEYVASEASKYSVNDSLFFKYFFKFIDYAFESNEMYDDAEKNVLELVSVLEKNKLFDQNYQKACDYLYRISIKQRNKNQATQAINRLSYLLMSSENQRDRK